MALVNPVGDFPLNDDFAYGLTVKALSRDRRLSSTPVPWAPIVTNVLWGTLFCLPGGFSFTALRVSTLVLSWLGVIGCYVLVRDTGARSSFALLAALTLGFNPIYHALSYTFMTDVPFTALLIWAVVFFVRGMKSGSNYQLLLGTVLALAATLSRQIGLCIPLAYATTCVLTRERTIPAAARASIPFILCAGAFLAFRYWLTITGRSQAFVDTKTDQLLQTLGSVLALSLQLCPITCLSPQCISVCFCCRFRCCRCCLCHRLTRRERELSSAWDC